MLWAVCHEWPSDAQFTFNCNCLWATLVVRDTEEGSGQFLNSKEGMTQGGPLVMIGVIEQWASPMSRLPRHDERPADYTGELDRVQTCWGRKNLAAVDVKCLLYVTGQEAKAACGTEQLSRGVEAGI